jgi:type II secretory pathway pseudopilin PulG
MTLPEILIALVIFSAVMAGALSLMTRETRALSNATDRMNALQNVRYAVDMLAQDLRAAGMGTLANQPFLVYAGPDVVVVNADHSSNVASDPFAIYYDPDAPTGAVTALTQAQRFTLPNTAFAYPDTTYRDAVGVNSPAETIIFYFSLDSTTTRTDDYVLMRQVNRLPPELLARNLLRTSGQDFFQFQRLVNPPNIQAVPSGSLPLRHTVPGHAAVNDTGAAARVDSIRGVRLNLTGTNGMTGTRERRRSVSRYIRFPNAGLASKKVCGDEPLLGVGLNAALTVGADGLAQVTLTWNRGTDDQGGENDVVRYVIWRREAAAPDFGEPYQSIPAGQVTYVFNDELVESGVTYYYAMAAQDCTPKLSAWATAGPISIP